MWCEEGSLTVRAAHDALDHHVAGSATHMQIFVSGTWKESKALTYREQGLLLGESLADQGFDLACGPGTGIARHVIDGYRSRTSRGVVRYYLPLAADMAAVGEGVEPGADEIEQTDFDYPMRNVYQVSKSQGLFVLTGGDGTLEEILPAVIDYEIPVGIVEGAGTAATAVRSLLEVYPEWSPRIVLGSSVEAVLPAFNGLVGTTRRSVPGTGDDA